MWLLDALTSGFSTPTSENRLQYFRILIGVACFVKFALALLHRGWFRLERGGYTHYALKHRMGEEQADLISTTYRPVVAIRLLASVAVICGVEPKISALLVLCGLFYELIYEYRYNTIYMALMVACLLPAGNLGTGFSFSDRISSTNTWAQFLAVLITLDLYWNGVWLKVRSPHFMSGLLLAQYVHGAEEVKDRLPYREFFYPRPALKALDDSPAGIKKWRLAAQATIVLEAVIPIALFLPQARPWAISIGLLLHTGFALLKPRGIIGFSIATLASYILFVP
ncbi:hypothetical protein AB0D38_16110 [Streptomyces sp. NPDC048279]|uniref:hypothetical protein n=1 Tax=Streptomyces sp. NPDC048279 TaxID=3154714 RepID=UPI00343E3C9B